MRAAQAARRSGRAARVPQEHAVALQLRECLADVPRLERGLRALRVAKQRARRWLVGVRRPRRAAALLPLVLDPHRSGAELVHDLECEEAENVDRVVIWLDIEVEARVDKLAEAFGCQQLRTLAECERCLPAL